MKISEIRERKNHSLAEAAEILDCHRSYLSKIENGRAFPRPSLALAILRYADGEISAEEMLLFYEQKQAEIKEEQAESSEPDDPQCKKYSYG